jgi:hypothetical protein
MPCVQIRPAPLYYTRLMYHPTVETLTPSCLPYLRTVVPLRVRGRALKDTQHMGTLCLLLKARHYTALALNHFGSRRPISSVYVQAHGSLPQAPPHTDPSMYGYRRCRRLLVVPSLPRPNTCRPSLHFLLSLSLIHLKLCNLCLSKSGDCIIG